MKSKSQNADIANTFLAASDQFNAVNAKYKNIELPDAIELIREEAEQFCFQIADILEVDAEPEQIYLELKEPSDEAEIAHPLVRGYREVVSNLFKAIQTMEAENRDEDDFSPTEIEDCVNPKHNVALTNDAVTREFTHLSPEDTDIREADDDAGVRVDSAKIRQTLSGIVVDEFEEVG